MLGGRKELGHGYRQSGMRTINLACTKLLFTERKMASEYPTVTCGIQGMDLLVNSWKENLPLIFYFSNLMKEKHN